MVPAGETNMTSRDEWRDFITSSEAVLRDRLEAVRDALDRIGEDKRSTHASQLVHRLRVATRRADAAMQFLGHAAKRSRRRKTRRRLKKIRDAASFLRQCQVHHEFLLDLHPQLPHEHRFSAEAAALLCTADAERELDRLADAARTFARKKLTPSLNRFFESWARRIQEQAAPSDLKAEMDQSLQAQLEEVREAIDEQDFTEKHLHALRLRLKRLRYALEIVEELNPNVEFDPTLNVLRHLQDLLGAINDCIELEQRLRDDADRAERDLVLAPEAFAQDDAAPPQAKAAVPQAFRACADWVHALGEAKRDGFFIEWEQAARRLLLSTLDSLMLQLGAANPGDVSDDGSDSDRGVADAQIEILPSQNRDKRIVSQSRHAKPTP